VVVISGEVGVRKPERRIVEILLERLGNSPREYVYIDDKLQNLATASDFGLVTVHFIRENQEMKNELPFLPDYSIRSFRELLPLIKSIDGQ